MKPEQPVCLLCKLGYRRPIVPTPVIKSFVTDRGPVHLCRWHDALLHEWADENEHRKMLEMMAPHIYRGRSRKKK